MQTIEVPTKKERKFLPQDLVIDSWEKLEPYLAFRYTKIVYKEGT